MLRTDNFPGCSHCALASAAIEWRQSEAAQAKIAQNREAFPERAHVLSDAHILRLSLVRGLACVLVTILAEEADDLEGMDRLNDAFRDACHTARRFEAGEIARAQSETAGRA